MCGTVELYLKQQDELDGRKPNKQRYGSGTTSFIERLFVAQLTVFESICLRRETVVGVYLNTVAHRKVQINAQYIMKVTYLHKVPFYLLTCPASKPSSNVWQH